MLDWLTGLFSGSDGKVAAPVATESTTSEAKSARQSNKETVMSNTHQSATAYINNRVGPVMRAGELARAVAEAAVEDNPSKEIRIDDKRAYLRIDTDDEMILRRETIERVLGRPFKMNELEVDLSSFSGRIEILPNQVRFYFTKHLSI
jgi:toluene monooxygenase system protein D